MGNSGLKQHIENSAKTGVFQMKDAGLAEVCPTSERNIHILNFE